MSAASNVRIIARPWWILGLPIIAGASIAFVLFAFVASSAHAQGEAAPPSGLSKYFSSGAALRSGTFEGTLGCAGEDILGQPLAQCKLGIHSAVLIVENGIVHLFGTSAQVTEKLNSSGLHGKNVVVNGRYYPSNNTLLVADVNEKTAKE